MAGALLGTFQANPQQLEGFVLQLGGSSDEVERLGIGQRRHHAVLGNRGQVVEQGTQAVHRLARVPPRRRRPTTGAWRGGTGVEYEIDVHTEGTWSFRGEGLRYRTGYGAASGLDGEGGEMRVRPDDAPEFEAPKFGLRELGPARLVASSPGGGGFGDPTDRDPEAVLRDVRDGVVSIEAARRFYGVVIAPGGRRINADATARRRAALRGAGTPD